MFWLGANGETFCGLQDGSGEIELDEFLQMMAPKVLQGSLASAC